MDFSISSTVQTRITLTESPTGPQVPMISLVSMTEHQVRQLALLVGNPLVDEVLRVKWTYELLGFSLYEALCFVKTAAKFHEETYVSLKHEWDASYKQ